MRQETSTKIIIWISAAFLVAHLLFQDYEWWFPSLKQTQTMTLGTFLGCLGIIIGLLAFMMIGDMRSRSNFIATENERWSWNPAKDLQYPAGAYECVPLEGLNAYGGSFEGKGGTLVYHKDAWRRFGPNGFVLATSKPATLSELPPKVQNAIRRWKLPAPYYIAYAPAFVEARNRDYSEQERAMSIQNRVNSAATRVDLNSIMTMDQKVRVVANAVRDDGRPKIATVAQKVRRAFSPESEERSAEEDMERNG